MLRLGALTTVYVNNKNNTAHISKKKKRNKKGKRRGKKKKTLSAKGRGQRGGSVRDLEAVWNWRESQVPTENQIRRLTRWLAAFLSVCRRGGFRSNSSRSPQVTQLLPVSRFQSWNDDRDVSRSDPSPPPKFTSRIPSSPQLNKHNHTGWEHGNTAPPPAALPPRWQRVQLCDWEVSLFLKIELSSGVLWVSHCRPLKTSLVGS